MTTPPTGTTGENTIPISPTPTPTSTNQDLNQDEAAANELTERLLACQNDIELRNSVLLRSFNLDTTDERTHPPRASPPPPPPPHPTPDLPPVEPRHHYTNEAWGLLPSGSLESFRVSSLAGSGMRHSVSVGSAGGGGGGGFAGGSAGFTGSIRRIPSHTVAETNDEMLPLRALDEEGFLWSMERDGKGGWRGNGFLGLVSLACTGLVAIVGVLLVGKSWEGGRRQPAGPYVLIDKQEGKTFFSHYTFYSGADSEGSKGYINYVDKEKAFALRIANVTYEPLEQPPYSSNSGTSSSTTTSSTTTTNDPTNNRRRTDTQEEPFIYMSTTPTEAGPRNSVRLEGLKRYNRGLFILDVRHMPAGCGTWPAFWLSDEANWPVNGEIDVVEGVNTQTDAKTALHTTKGCKMDDVPLGVRSGVWDTAQGVPMSNGTIDMKLREANDCFVYNPHQWLNQGCVAVANDKNGTIGKPVNDRGGGIYVLEWDPFNRYIKSWVFSPGSAAPRNLRHALRTVHEGVAGKRVAPDPTGWGLPYAYFPIGMGTNCPGEHFKNMRIVFNMALCGSVAGNRFFMDCPELNEKYGSCDNYIAANTEAMNEVYWKIRGVYIYEREWERSWS